LKEILNDSGAGFFHFRLNCLSVRSRHFHMSSCLKTNRTYSIFQYLLPVKMTIYISLQFVIPALAVDKKHFMNHVSVPQYSTRCPQISLQRSFTFPFFIVTRPSNCCIDVARIYFLNVTVFGPRS
jgi:hypothetical protein